MHHTRFGEFLRNLIELSNHDIEEILQQQEMTKHRFGEIALEWGLCQPEHVWQAWCDQLSTGPQKVDLDQVGVDVQAIGTLPGDVAWEYHVLPIRLLPNQVILAARQLPEEAVMQRLGQILHRQIKLVLTDGKQLAEALEEHYPLLPAGV